MLVRDMGINNLTVIILQWNVIPKLWFMLCSKVRCDIGFFTMCSEVV